MSIKEQLKYFKVKLMNCGNWLKNGNSDLLKDTNAVKLMIDVNKMIADKFVGSEEKEQLLYVVSLQMLKELLYKREEVEKDLIEKLKGQFDKLSSFIEYFDSKRFN